MRIEKTISGITFFLIKALWIHFYDIDQLAWNWEINFPPAGGLVIATPLLAVGFTPESK